MLCNLNHYLYLVYILHPYMMSLPAKQYCVKSKNTIAYKFLDENGLRLYTQKTAYLHRWPLRPPPPSELLLF